MLELIFNYFLVLLSNTLTSELFYIPVIFCLCAYLFYIVFDMIRGRY